MNKSDRIRANSSAKTVKPPRNGIQSLLRMENQASPASPKMFPAMEPLKAASKPMFLSGSSHGGYGPTWSMARILGDKRRTHGDGEKHHPETAEKTHRRAAVVPCSFHLSTSPTGRGLPTAS